MHFLSLKEESAFGFTPRWRGGGRALANAAKPHLSPFGFAKRSVFAASAAKTKGSPRSLTVPGTKNVLISASLKSGPQALFLIICAYCLTYSLKE